MKDYEVEKLAKYIENLRNVLDQIDKKHIKDDEIGELVDLAEKYFSDAKYYYERQDYFTSLVCVTYAEGLLDALKFMDKIEFNWPFERKFKKIRRVMIAGTFDIIHPGHLWLIKSARKYGRVTVVVARDENAKRIKGRKPIISEKQRLAVVEGLKYVEKAVLGSRGNDIFKIIEEEKPDIFILGPDQDFISPEKLEKILEERGLKVKVIKIKEQFEEYPLCKTSKIIEEIKKRISRNAS